MLSIGIATIISAILAGVLGIAGSSIQNLINSKSVEDANKSNEKISEDTNAANVQQAQLSYQRSLPSNQVRNLMSAGLSRQGALSKLTGGGSYSAPVMSGAQVQPKHIDLSGMSAAMDRLGNLPSNYEQAKLQELQLTSLNQDIEHKAAEERRREQVFEYEQWQRRYGKDTATKLDAASNKISTALIDSGKNIQDFDSFEDMLRQLHLDKDPDITDIPHLARTQLRESVHNSYKEYIDRQEEERRRVAAEDAHKISEKTRQKLSAEIGDLNDSRDAKRKEYKLRAIKATVEQIAESRNLAITAESLRETFEFDSDGNVLIKDGKPVYKKDKPSNIKPEIYGNIRRFWDDVCEVLPVNVLQLLIRSILK